MSTIYYFGIQCQLLLIERNLLSCTLEQVKDNLYHTLNNDGFSRELILNLLRSKGIDYLPS